MAHGETTRGGGRLSGWLGVEAFLLVALFTSGALWESLQLSSLADGAIWGHLRAGMWIVENHRWPQTGLFSQLAGSSWRDLSWGYDGALAIGYKVLGLRVIPAATMLVRVILAGILFLLAGGRRGNFWIASGVAAVALCTLSMVGAESTMVSVLLLGTELILIFWKRRKASGKIFVFLPILFLLWANLDGGFVYGIGVLGLFLVCTLVENGVRDRGVIDQPEAKMPTGKAFALLGLCAGASLVTPYGYHGYEQFWEMQTSAANAEIPGYAALGFRRMLDYAVLGLGMSAFLAMGRKRSKDLFGAGLLVGSGLIGFYSQRDAWIFVVSSVAVAGEMLQLAETDAPREPAQAGGFALALGTSLLVAALGLVLLMPRSDDILLAKAGESLPVNAADYIRQHGLPKPMFNAYSWGAFLTWYLPEYPVAIDGRRGLYSEDVERDYFRVMKVDMPYQEYAPMRDARTILLEKANAVGEALRTIRGYRVAYEDRIAVVLVREASE